MRTNEAGYSIVEVMIVLAVTALLFVGIVRTMAGRQGRTEFTMAVQELKTQIAQTITETVEGYYPNLGNFTCTNVGGVPSIVTGSQTQGANKDCIFLGKAIQFDVNGTDPEEFVTYSIVGVRQSSNKEVTTLAQANPRVLAPATSAPNVPDNTQTRLMRNGITTLWVRYGSASTDIGAFGFLSTLASYSGNDLQSGSQQVTLVPISSTALNKTKAAMAEDINDYLTTSPTDGNEQGIKMCVVSASSKQSGLLTIGGKGRDLSVDLKVKENTTCS